jgi:hypothetical protein
VRSRSLSRGGTIGIALNGGQHAREWISVMVLALAESTISAAR